MKKKKVKEIGITALYERLSRDDDGDGDSNSIVHQKQMLETIPRMICAASWIAQKTRVVSTGCGFAAFIASLASCLSKARFISESSCIRKYSYNICTAGYSETDKNIPAKGILSHNRGKEHYYFLKNDVVF